MSQRSERSVCGVGLAVRVVAMLTLMVMIALPRASSATPPTPLNVLFVANGNYTQETNIYNHLLGLGFTVTKLKDYKLTGTTNLAPYNLIIITEFAPNIPTSGLNNIKSSGKPVLIVEYWDFWYSYKLGLVTTKNCGYVGTDDVEMVDLDSRTAEYVGDDPQVYSTSYTVYGISELDLKPGVKPVAWSSVSFGEYAIIADPSRKIVATGVYDTRKYTPEAWRLFDELIDEIAPMGPAWASQDEEIQGLVDSGVISYIRNLSGNEPAATVLAYVWSRIFTYNLHNLAHVIEWELQQKGPGVYVLYPDLHILVPHDSYDDDEHDDMSWFMGEQYDRDTGEYSVPFYDPKVMGADLGVSALVYNRTYFYMGDTWDVADPSIVRTGCVLNVINGTVVCNDAIVRLAAYEDDPTDGLDAVVISDPANPSVFLPQTIDGVHRNYGENIWAVLSPNEYNYPFSVPTGASSGIRTEIWWSSTAPGVWKPVIMFFPYVHLWYGTQITRDHIVDDSYDPDKTGKSWVGCSINGKTFNNCYKYNDSLGDKYAYFSKEKFISVAPVEIGVDELTAMGLDSLAPSDSTGGTLLFGSAHPYRCSALYLAYIDKQDFGQVDDMSGRPINVLYYSGGVETWTPNEGLAAPIFDPDCLETYDDLTEPAQIDLWDDWSAISRTSAEEYLWTWATESIPAWISGSNSGCQYTGIPSDCNTSECWVAASDITNDPLDSYECHMCTEVEISDCLDHIMTYESLGDYPWPTTEGFGELSVKLMKTDSVSAFVMLSNHPLLDWPERGDMVAAAIVGAKNNPITDHSAGGFSRLDYTWEMGHVFYRSAPVSTPWSWSPPTDTGTPGYGPYIIDEFSWANTVWPDDPNEPPIHSVVLWHMTSVWHGSPAGHQYGLPGAYGVYTTYTVQGLDVE